MAARSLRLTASARWPMSAADEWAREKCTPSTTVSVVTTSRSFLAGTRTAASSPGPTTTEASGRGRHARRRASNPCSPSSATVKRVSRFAVWGGSLNLRKQVELL
jgi:hypothetical protein